MKTRPTIILALCTILIGALLIAFPTQATNWLVIAIGALFLVPGLYTVGSYLWMRHKRKVADKENANNKDSADKLKDKGINAPAKVSFPFIGIGSILFGSVLLAIPGSFHKALLYLLGAFLVLGGLTQLYRFLQLRKSYKLSATPYIVASLISIAGIVIIILNYNTSNKVTDNPYYWPSIIFGVASIVFGLTEIIYAIQFRKQDQSSLASQPQPIEIIPPVSEEPQTATAQEPQPAPEPAPVPQPQPTPEPTPVPQPTPEVRPNTIEAEVDSEA